MKIYLVVKEYHDYIEDVKEIIGAYTTKEGARERVKIEDNNLYYYSIEEIDLIS